jgi:hypothetical protein
LNYQIIKAVGIGKNIGSQWRDIDTDIVIIRTLFTDFYKVYIELSHNSIPDNIYVDFDIFKPEYFNFEGGFNDMLTLVGDATLPTISSLPDTSIKYVKFSDASRAFYKVQLAMAGQNLPDNYPNSSKNDAFITRPTYNTDMSLLDSHALITVNGYIHETISNVNDDKIYVYDAGKTLRRSRNNNVGIISFLDVSKLTKIHLSDDQIYTQEPNGLLYERTYIDTKVDLSNRAYFLVLGGYLVLPEENVLWKVNDTTVGVNFNMLKYIERIYESIMVLDLSHLELNTEPGNDIVFNIEQLKSNEVLRKYMLAKNTFIVALDISHLTYNKIYLRHSNMPGIFTSYQHPMYPLIVNYGRLAEYWSVLEDDQWSITVNDSYLKQFVIDFYSNPELNLINGNLIPMKPNQHSRGYLLEIGGYNI